jgi:2-polyprenyl-3-methyl-5-hydroxy-6-metoxy-1,4-benzoquinol methylase
VVAGERDHPRFGCGFGLFSRHFAALRPDRCLVGVDLDARRIEMARTSARRLGLANVEYEVGDALDWTSEARLAGACRLDVFLHPPREAVPEFLRALVARIDPGGTLLLEEVSNRPRYKTLFTLLLDRLVACREPIHDWPPAELTESLRSLELDVKRYQMNDQIPYPHMLYICRSRSSAPSISG